MIVGFDPYTNSSSTTNPNEFFNFDQHNSLITGTGDGNFSRFDDDPSLQRCVLIPCEPNERPSQGLSLSLSSTNPSTIGIQPFELVRPPQDQQHNHHNLHQGYFGKPKNNMHQQQHDQSGEYNIRCSRYLVHAQDLLNEFCNLGTNQNDHSSKAKVQRTNQWQDHDNLHNNNKKPLNSSEFLELQKRKSKLLQLQEEVNRKYHNYCDQMKAMVLSFEELAGHGAAKVYSTLASKAMSRHFRCLRDGIVVQIKATKKAMGEKEISAPGATRGETPRLRLLDQNLRQQRTFQQMTTLDSHLWRPQRGLPERSVSILRAWLFEHFLHPYPSDVDKHILARQTGLSRSQVSNWFINARVRLWKPMVEEMYMEETKENEIDENTPTFQMDQKPNADELIIRRDSDCLSSIINHHENFSSTPFGGIELGFSTYTHSFGGGGGSGGGGVSLTLGLQQHGGDHDGVGGGGGGGDGGGCGGDSGGGVSLYYPRYQMEDCQSALQYSSLLEGDQGQNLAYRNSMGAQLLHDLAG